LPDVNDPVPSVLWLLRGHWATFAIRAAIELRVFDTLDVPRTAPQLAELVGADASALDRLLQVLESLSLLSRDDRGGYVVNALGETLRSGHASALREVGLMQTESAVVDTWLRLSDAVRTNEGVFESVNGVTAWEHIGADPRRAARFNAAMARRGPVQATAIRTACDLADVSTVVDVGGGKGGMLIALLQQEPGISAVLADRPDMVSEAEQAFAEAGLADRATGVAADFFESVPAGGDAYVLSNVLHDWRDDDCVAILKTVRAAMRPTARLWIVEMVLDAPGRAPEAGRDLRMVDLHMLVMFGARERTAAEYGGLLTAAGFDAGTLLATRANWNVIEARPA
jgi:hypothetical protein